MTAERVEAVAHVDQSMAWADGIRIEADPVVADAELENSVPHAQLHRHARAAAAVLGAVLDRLQTAEIRSALDRSRGSTQLLAFDRDRNWAATRRCRKRRVESIASQQRRVEPVCELRLETIRSHASRST